MSKVELFKKIYDLLDSQALALVDCGTLCGKRCCCYNFPQDTGSGMELIPGEEGLFPLDAGWHQWAWLTGEIYDYPSEWGTDAGCYQIRCKEPCPREQRPVNCRLFPFQVYFSEGRYYLILTEAVCNYECPLIRQPELINPGFIEFAKEAAKLLLQIPKFKQLVEWDSEEIDLEEIQSKFLLSS